MCKQALAYFWFKRAGLYLLFTVTPCYLDNRGYLIVLLGKYASFFKKDKKMAMQDLY